VGTMVKAVVTLEMGMMVGVVGIDQVASVGDS
jgi:TctA family transporter